MQDDEKGGQMLVNLRKFICCANKAIWSSIRDFDEAQEWRMANEFLPGDGDLCDAPSMQVYLDGRPRPRATVFRRSDDKGEPMWIHREDLAEAIEALHPTEQDFLIKIFQEELPIALYAAEEGISPSMAYRRKDAILNRLWKSLILRRLKENEWKSETAQGKAAKSSETKRKTAGRVHRAGHHRRAKR